MTGSSRVKAFAEESFYDYSNNTLESFDRIIENKGKDYILRVDEEKFINYLVSEYSLESLEIGSMLPLNQPSITKEMRNDVYGRGGTYQVDVYNFTAVYPFTGSPELFRLRPSTFNWTSYELYINTARNTVSFSFKLYSQDEGEFKKVLNECWGHAFSNLKNSNAELVKWN